MQFQEFRYIDSACSVTLKLSTVKLVKLFSFHLGLYIMEMVNDENVQGLIWDFEGTKVGVEQFNFNNVECCN